MPWAIPILVSLAISFAFTVISRLLQPQQQRFTGGVQPDLRINQPGTLVTLRQPAQPHQLIVGETRVQGDITFMQDSDDKQNLNLIVTWAGHEVESLGKLYFNEEEVTVDGAGFGTGKWTGFVYVSDHLGSPTQTADADLMARLPGVWTEAHRGRGRAYSYIRIYNDPKIFPNGLPNMWRVAKGMKFYDHRSGLTAWTDNASLIQAGFLAHAKYGIGAVYATEQDLAALDAAASDCDDAITLAAGGSEKRYTCNGAWRCDRLPADVIPELLSASYGTLVLVGGKWTLRAGVYEEPTLRFGEKHFRAPFTLRNLLGADQSFNGIKGTYRNPEKNYQKDDWPAVRSNTYVAEDGGEEKFRDGDFPFTTSASMAQRLGRIELRQARQPLRFTAQLNCSGLRIVSGSTIGFDDPVLGWTNKPFRVIELRMVFGQIDLAGGGKSPTGIIGVDVDVRETSSSIYDWTSSDEVTVDPAPNSSLPDVFSVIPPANLIVTEELYVGRDGAGVKTRAKLSWEPSPDGFVRRYQPEWRDAGGTWKVQAQVTGTATSIDDMEPGAKEFRLAAVNSLDVMSAYITAVAELTGLLAPPQAPQNMTLTAIGGGAYIRFDPTVDLDVQHGGWIVFRHSPAMTGATWDKASPLDKLEGRSTHAWLALKAGSYLARFLDSSGRYSVNTAIVVCKQASALTFTPATGGTLQEDSTFTGTKTNCSVSGGKLGLTPGQASGTYLWHAKMDLGSVKNVRITVNQATEVENATDTWDSAELCDSDEPWDAAVTGNEAFAITYVRTTDDDPAGTPTWGAWTRIDSGEFRAWGFDFKTELTAVDVNYVVKIPALAAAAEEVA